jgi:methylated-DNA-protein-cysteine methyltransferase related protein
MNRNMIHIEALGVTRVEDKSIKRNRKNIDPSNLLPNMSDFYEKVYETVKMIPLGRVTSYGAIAKYLGSTGSARMVGWALNVSHQQLPHVPAHRVVNRNGLLTGKIHFGYSTAMQELLENEGVKIVDDCVVDFERLFWDPGKELI